ncbi:MAG: hypothetical protein AAF519_07835, partial [Bacteroidota bacterium]
LSYILGVLVALTVLYSCSQPEKETYVQRYELVLDSLILPLDNFSGKGRLEIYGDTILYLDELYAQATLYTLAGDSAGRKLNKGRNYAEIPVIENYLHLPDGSHLLMEGWNFYHYSKAWEYRGKFRINWSGRVGYNDLMLEPEKYVDVPDMYELSYIHSQISMLTDSTIFFNIDTEHMRFNAFTTEGYYKEARTFAELSLRTGRVKRVFGKKSPAYRQYAFVPHLIGQYFASGGPHFYVGYEVDPKIYQYDRDFNPITEFGVAGIGMNTNYVESNTVETADDTKAFHASRTTEGYYTHLWYSPERELLFRTYTTGGKYNRMKQNPKRLQIYEDRKLVADVDVPDRFRVLAYRAPYYYAEGILDEGNSRLGIYRFQVNTLAQSGSE